MADFKPCSDQKRPEWALMVDPQAGTINAVRCVFVESRCARGWKLVATEQEWSPWPWAPPPMDMSQLSGPQTDEGDPA